MQWLLLVPLLLFLVLFGVSNRQEVALTLWPFDLAWITPIAVAVLLFSAVFFLLGALIAWSAGFRHRSRARQLEQAVRVLEAEVATHRAAQAKDLGAVPPPPGGGLALMRR